jgi:hypothetical protein
MKGQAWMTRLTFLFGGQVLAPRFFPHTARRHKSALSFDMTPTMNDFSRA